MDRHLVWAAETYGWPPSVTREQSMRDLMLLQMVPRSNPGG